jgi:mRNA m6A methyltransferase catalytic subunit
MNDKLKNGNKVMKSRKLKSLKDCCKYKAKGKMYYTAKRENEYENQRLFDEEYFEMYKQVKIDQIKTDSTAVPIPFTLEDDRQISEIMSIFTEVFGKKFDVIMMDPPWKVGARSRGIDVIYKTLNNVEIANNLKLHELQTEGFCFVWVINQSEDFAMQWLTKCHYQIIDRIDWIKIRSNSTVFKSNGNCLQHSKEAVLVGFKTKEMHEAGVEECGGKYTFMDNKHSKLVNSAKALQTFCCGHELIDRYFELNNISTILGVKRMMSQKPMELYELIERLIPSGLYLEMFGRRNNMREGWVTMGNQI